MLADELSPVFSDSIVKLKEINKAGRDDIDGQKELQSRWQVRKKISSISSERQELEGE
jgi:hypothetical protein